MKCPRKIYLVISRKAKSVASPADVALSYKEATRRAAARNKQKMLDATDWKPEPYNKGD